jgi:N-acetyl-alpha-D-muramate 1-phosphate uridylyltransferase
VTSVPKTGLVTAVPKTAMVMAAGMGTRMMPLTADRPKPLVTVAGTSLIDHVFDHVRSAGVAHVVINVHYRADQMEAYAKAHADGLDIVISDERTLLRDTGGGLVQAKPLIADDPFLCINADNYWTNGSDNALTRLSAQWDGERMDVLMLVVPFADAHNTQGKGDFHLDADGLLSRRLPGEAAPFVWTGIQIMSKRLIDQPPSDVFSTNIFWDRAIAAGRAFGVVHDGLWFDVGYPAAIAATEAILPRG